jgi:hypothetical protein
MTEIAGSSTSASETSSNPISATSRSRPARRSARTPPIVRRFCAVKNALGGFDSASISSTAAAADSGSRSSVRINDGPTATPASSSARV